MRGKKDFLEEELGKQYDYKLMLRLFKYARPYLIAFIISLILLFLSVGTEIIRPYLIKVSIDDYIINKNVYFMEDIDGEFEYKNTKFARINRENIDDTSNIYFTLIKSEKGYYLFNEVVDGKEVDYDSGILLKREEVKELRKDTLDGLEVLGIIFLCTIVIGFVLNFFQIYILNRISQRILFNIRSDMFKHLLNLPFKFFDKNPIGRLVTRISNDTETINEMFTNVLVNFFKDISIFIGVLIIMLFLNVKLTFIVILSLPVISIAAYFFRKNIRTIYRGVRVNLANINSLLSEYISGMKIIQLFNRETESVEKFKIANEEYYNSTLKEIKLFGLFRPFIEMISTTVIAFLILYGGSRVIDRTLELGVIMAFSNYIALLYQPINSLAEKFNIFQAAMASSERIFGIMNQKEEIYISGKETNVSNKGNIEFKNVWFGYNKEEYVLKDVSFKIKSGETLAVVGATGSGKTTIISLINMFYNLDKGEILIDNKSIYDYNTKDIRRSISYVPQDVFMFKGDIKNNITLNDEFLDVDVVKASKNVNASVFIDKLPSQYDEEVIEGGATLSSGQRQLISFARAIIREPSILVLDEATSNIDTETEKLIQDALDNILNNRTTIIIAHRLSTIKKADKILVMNKGKIVETGTHNELMENKSYYFDLYNLQYKLG